MEKLSCFKAYDVRGKVPEEVNEDLVYGIGLAYASEFRPSKPVAVGYDIRLTSRDLSRALIEGLTDGGVDTYDIGLCGTEMIYFAASRPDMGGGIMITASHNPKEYNGIKMVREGAVPISGDSELPEIERRVRQKDFRIAGRKGTARERSFLDAYLRHILGFVHLDTLKPLKLVVNSGNGCAGPVLDALAAHLPFEFVRLLHEPDGTFPNGVPNPLLPENRTLTSDTVRSRGADLGVAWDGDFDRCFLFDEEGGFVEGYYIVGLLAAHLLQKERGARIVHDTRLVWNTIDIVRERGGEPVQSKTGHAFMKATMRRVDALYGGEMSAHHYFRDFAYCDSGMIPWLLVAEAVCREGRSLKEMMAERMRRFPCSGEINRIVDDQDGAIERVRRYYEPQRPAVETLDGLSMAFDDRWRFNLRKSNTEPILRLNVESRGDPSLMKEKTEEILDLVGGEPPSKDH